jgi:hypothetical protein
VKCCGFYEYTQILCAFNKRILLLLSILINLATDFLARCVTTREKTVPKHSEEMK